MSQPAPAHGFDAASLLNPKASTKQAKPAKTQPQQELPIDGDEEMGQASFLEQRFGVQHREHKLNMGSNNETEEHGSENDQPKKKQKMDKDIPTDGPMGKALKDHRKEIAERRNETPAAFRERQPQANGSGVVDLTGEDDGGAVEVCLGRIDNARVSCYKVPQPKAKSSYQSNHSHWMAMTVSLYRRPGPNQVIGVVDPMGVDFGSVDARVAKALCQLMDGAKVTKLRLTARLDQRKKQPFDFPGQPISASYNITITVYAQRKYVKGIGKFLSHNQIWLRDPIVLERGAQLVNPHGVKDHTPQQRFGASRSAQNGQAQPSTRTNEEIRQDVSKVFDTISEAKEFPEMNAPGQVVTSLLSHQKQAIYFLNLREQLPTYTNTGDTVTIDDEGDDDEQNAKVVPQKSSDADEHDKLWQRKMQRNGTVLWRNAITGHVMQKRPRLMLGGILADVMGLGKTLNILSLVVGSLQQAKQFISRKADHDEEYEDDLVNSKGTLLVCPLSTIVNWEEQGKAHLRPRTIKYLIYQGSNRTNEREDLLKYDLVITTYQVVSNELSRNSLSRPNKPLFEINWFRVVLDEAHQIRNTSSMQSKAACEIQAERRWCVTGTPVQNRLEDLGALIKFLKISPFDELSNFGEHISTPLRKGDADAIAKLRILVDSITLRRLKDKLNLPARVENIVHLRMTEPERSLYDQFALDTNRKVNAMVGDKEKLGGKSYAQVLKAILRLRMLCAHKEDMLSDEDWEMAKGFDATNAIDLEDEDDSRAEKNETQRFEMFRLMRDASLNYCATCLTPINPADNTDHLEDDEDEAFGYLTPCNQMFCYEHIKVWKKEMNAIKGADNRANCIHCDAYIRITYDELDLRHFLTNEQTQGIIQKSKFARNLQRYSHPHTKTMTLLSDLAEAESESQANPDERPIKSVVFSEWTTHLDLIQLAFTNAKVKYTRLDGSMRFSQRTEALTTFAESWDVNVILVSLKAGGLGLNLTAASRVFVMEPNYNPAAEQQAIERVHRLGQERDVLIRRYIMEDSIEGKIVQLQKRKLDLASFSIDRDSVAKSGNNAEARNQKMKQTLEDLKSLLR